MPRIDWQLVGEQWTVSVPLPPPPCCPHCGVRRRKRGIVRSKTSEGDGSVTRYCVCESCSEPYIEIAAFDELD